MTTKLTESGCFALLANGRRRLLVRILQECCTTPLPVEEVTERIAALECEDPTEDDLYYVRLSLYHKHIPRLEDADVVSYDRDDETITPRPNFDTLVHLLDRVNERDGSWANP